MVITDPGAELLELVRAMGDPAPCSATDVALRRAELIRRRFGLALPPPFVAAVPEMPIRVAEAEDGPAVAAVKWRVFGTDYRGILPDEFLDRREVVPPPGFWTGRAVLPPTRRHRLFVAGRSGMVVAYLDCGPAQLGDGDDLSDSIGEIYELYVDPCAQGQAVGTALVDAAESWLVSVGFVSVELSAIDTNHRAHEFYERHGWTSTGDRLDVDLGSVAFVERRFTKAVGAPPAAGSVWNR